MSYIAGIDYSTHAIDVVLLDENKKLDPVWHRWQLSGQDAFGRVRSIDHVVASTNVWGEMWDDVLAVGIEDPRGQNAGALYRVQGAILACIPRYNLVQPWIPSQWRKAVGLPGNCAKDRVTLFAHQAIREDQIERHALRTSPWPQDACDAYCIALATRAAIQVGAAA